MSKKKKEKTNKQANILILIWNVIAYNKNDALNLVCTLSGDAANELHYVWLIAVTENFSQLDLSHQTFSSFLPCSGYNKKDIFYSREKILVDKFSRAWEAKTLGEDLDLTS